MSDFFVYISVSVISSFHCRVGLLSTYEFWGVCNIGGVVLVDLKQRQKSMSNFYYNLLKAQIHYFGNIK